MLPSSLDAVAAAAVIVLERERPTHNARSRLGLATGIESGALFFFGHERKKIICIGVGGTELRRER